MKKYRLSFIYVLFLFSLGTVAQEKQTFKFIEINKKLAWDGGYIQRDFEAQAFICGRSITPEEAKAELVKLGLKK
jgi:hypothetical protein